MSPATALDIAGLSVEFGGPGETVVAVSDVSLNIGKGEIHAIVGESGAGKTTVGNAVLGLIDPPGRITSGDIHVAGKRAGINGGIVPGRDIGAIFQDPMTSLNPLFSVGSQISETMRRHLAIGAAEALTRSVELMRLVGIPEPERRYYAFPHQLSGGQRQRIVIATALSCDPQLIIADEPTTALDVSVEAQILALIRKLVDERGIGVMLVTHNMSVVSRIADRVTIMQKGCVVETGPVRDILLKPREPYSRALIAAVPQIDRPLARFPVFGEHAAPPRGILSGIMPGKHTKARGRSSRATILQINGVTLEYGHRGWLRKDTPLRALDDVSLDLREGEILGIVGESGSGKSTLAQSVVGLLRPQAGSILLHDRPIERGCRDIQMIFQDPYSSLNPRMRVFDAIIEPIRLYERCSAAEARERAALLLEAVGLGADAGERYPHAFSGGQRQRISISRALSARPNILICDEPTSALDVSVQARILNMLKDMRDETGLTMMFISHDLAVIRQMCDRVAVMKSGQLVEVQGSDELFTKPQHEYTRNLLAAASGFRDGQEKQTKRKTNS